MPRRIVRLVARHGIIWIGDLIWWRRIHEMSYPILHQLVMPVTPIERIQQRR